MDVSQWCSCIAIIRQVNLSKHDVNAIKIAGSDIVARVRYHTECILSCEQIFAFLFQSSNHSFLLL